MMILTLAVNNRVDKTSACVLQLQGTIHLKEVCTMNAAWIGIKLADSKFFPVMEEGTPVSKVLELTTVRDDQTSVQINLFRGDDATIETASYVGTLIIEDIANRKGGEPTIELTLSLDENNELSAEAVDLDSGSRQALTVSLETLSSEDQLGLPDFDLTPVDTELTLGEDPEHRNLVVDSDIPGNAPEGLYEMTAEEKKKSGVFLPAWLCVVILLLGVAALALALLVSAHVMRLNRTISDAAPGAAAPAVPVTEPEAPPVVAEETPPPVAPDTEPVAKPVEEQTVAPSEPEPVQARPVQYNIVWGDTLWDLADAYYRDPWLYTRIATHNRIRNPNLIIAGTRIEIPPK